MNASKAYGNPATLDPAVEEFLSGTTRYVQLTPDQAAAALLELAIKIQTAKVDTLSMRVDFGCLEFGDVAAVDAIAHALGTYAVPQKMGSGTWHHTTYHRNDSPGGVGINTPIPAPIHHDPRIRVASEDGLNGPPLSWIAECGCGWVAKEEVTHRPDAELAADRHALGIDADGAPVDAVDVEAIRVEVNRLYSEDLDNAYIRNLPLLAEGVTSNAGREIIRFTLRGGMRFTFDGAAADPWVLATVQCKVCDRAVEIEDLLRPDAVAHHRTADGMAMCPGVTW